MNSVVGVSGARSSISSNETLSSEYRHYRQEISEQDYCEKSFNNRSGGSGRKSENAKKNKPKLLILTKHAQKRTQI